MMKIYKNLLLLTLISTSGCNLYSNSPLIDYVMYSWHTGLRIACLVEGGNAIKSIGASLWYKKQVNSELSYSIAELTCGNLSESSRLAFAVWSRDDFEEAIMEMMETIPYEEQDEAYCTIVTQYNLYQFPAFVAYISKWPEFKENLKNLQEHLLYNKRLQQELYNLQGFEGGAFFNFIQRYADND